MCAHGVCTLNWMSVSHSLSTRQSNSSPWSSSEALPVSVQASKLTLNCQLRVPKLERSRGCQTAFTFTSEPLSYRSERSGPDSRDLLQSSTTVVQN